MGRFGTIGLSLCFVLGLAACPAEPAGNENNDNANDNVNSYVLQELSCPGTPSCADEGDGTFSAGAVVVDLTPTDLKEGPSFVDVNGNGEYDSNVDTYTDSNGNHKFDAVWIAGFDSRPATGFHDPIEARILAMRHNETTVIFISGDFIGFFYDHLKGIYDLLPSDVRDEVDIIVWNSSHTHEGPDMVGIWGQSYVDSGFDPVYVAWVQEQVAANIGGAIDALVPVTVTHGAIAVEDSTGYMKNLFADGRDPVIINNEMNVMKLATVSDDTTVATLVNLGTHPEAMWSRNPLLSADFPYYMRNAIEDGIPGLMDGIGGVAFFVQGTCGGLIGPGYIDPIDDSGQHVQRHTWAATEAFGHRFAEFAIAALDATNGATVDPDPFLSFRSKEIFLRVDNFNFQAAYRLGIFERSMYNWNPEQYIDETNTPDIISQLVYLQVGLASMITTPGEMAPEIFIGCYDGSCAGGWDFIHDSNPNKPDVSLAPSGPYLRDLLENDGSQFQWLIGLGQDEVGYILPNYDYKLDEFSPYLFEPEGDHYEETNSLGPHVRDQVLEASRSLINGD